jgi:hypothetical protein
MTISCDTPGALIYFTTDGSLPQYEKTELGNIINGDRYYSPITISEDTTRLAMAFADGKNDSEPVMEIYSITEGELPAAAPVTANPSGGTITSGAAISLSTATAGATIRYTTDSSEPTESSAVYTAPIPLFMDTTVKAKAFKDGMAPGGTSVFRYTVTIPVPPIEPPEPPVDPDASAVSVGNVSGKPGDEVIVPVTLSNNPGMAGFNFKISFDNTKLLPISISQGPALNLGSVTSNLQAGGDLSKLDSVTAIWSNASDFTGNGVIYSVKFRIKDDAPEGAASLTLTYEEGDVTNQTFEDIELAVLPGEINISTFIYGNIFSDNGDTAINTKDAVKLAQYLAGWTTVKLSAAEFKAADVYDDGAVNTKDAVKLAQYLAGWPNIILGTKQ